jgi:enterochelin esterase family protein
MDRSTPRSDDDVMRRLLRTVLATAAAIVPLDASTSAAQAASSVGRVSEHVLYDSIFGRARHVWVYTPPGYDARRPTPYPVIVAFDGREYLDTMPLPQVLDSLLASGRAPAFVALLVDDSSSSVRLAELANQERFTGVVSDQLLSWLRRGFNVTRDPHRTILTGSSAGGLAAAFIAFQRPELFGNVLAQSGAFWRGAAGRNGPPYEWLASQYAGAPKKDITFVLDVGAEEDHRTLGGGGPNFLDASRRFRDVLRRKGYPVTYTELPGGVHAPITWRPRLGPGIAALTAAWPR